MKAYMCVRVAVLAWLCGCSSTAPESNSGGVGGSSYTSSPAGQISPSDVFGSGAGPVFGSSGSGCIPASDPCKRDTCGKVLDNCGNLVSCGTCYEGQVCTPDLKCCWPITADKCSYALPYGTCNWQPDGCGGSVYCGKSCGEDDGFLTCKDDGRCHCINAMTEPNYTNAQIVCLTTPHHYPAYCWGSGPTTPEGRLDIPKDCYQGPDAPTLPHQLFCCDSPQ